MAQSYVDTIDEREQRAGKKGAYNFPGNGDQREYSMSGVVIYDKQNLQATKGKSGGPDESNWRKGYPIHGGENVESRLPPEPAN